MNLVSLNMDAIDPPPAKRWRYRAQECYWWTDDAGDLNIAMKCTRRNLLLGRLGDFDFYFSFVLKEPPAGSGRDYKIQHREVRSVGVHALQSFRFSSYAGIICALTGDDGTYSGSFRVGLTSHSELSLFSFIPRRPGSVVCFGSYHAVHDPGRGRAIRERTEADGWQRPPKPPATTRPAAHVQR